MNINQTEIENVQGRCIAVWQKLKMRFNTLPTWHKFICKTAIEKGLLESTNIDLAYRYFCIAHQLIDDEETVPESSIDDIVPSDSEATFEQIKLEKLANLKNINAIPATASLSFHTGLTIIYGKNGTGKSGFARVLKASCFSRAGNIKIEPDFRNPESYKAHQQAEIYLSGSDDSIVFDPNAHNPHLQRIAFFDADAASNHVSGYNSLEFVPAGIDVLNEEARVFGLLKTMLQKQITERTTTNTFIEQLGEGESSIKAAITSLAADTNLENLKTLATFEAAELDELNQLYKEKKSLIDSSTLLQNEKDGLPRLISFIEQFEAFAALFNEEASQRYMALLDNKKLCLEKVRTLQATLTIDMGRLETEWRNFIGMAHTLGMQISPQYPSLNDPCLLCGQPVDNHDALGHIQQFWSYLQDNASVELQEAQQQIDEAIATLNSKVFDICNDQTLIRGYLFLKSQPLIDSTDAFIIALGNQRNAVIQFLMGETETIANKVNAAPSPITDLTATKDAISAKIKEIEEKGTTALIAACSSKITLLLHRRPLVTMMPAIETYVEELKWIKKANVATSKLNAGSINTKKTQLVKEFLEGNYEGRFNDELKKLGFDHLKVSCDSRSRGTESTEKFFRIRSLERELSPEKILSEGEQKALALADFLAGLYINPEFCGAIFDDPVTSLDYDIRECVAHRLVEESEFRQIIVFTHDLVFLNQLISSAKSKSFKFLSHWVERQGDAIGVVNEGECPVTSTKFSNTDFAKARLQDAFTNHTGEARNVQVKTAMGYLRRTLEQAVIEALFNKVVKRWDDRIVISRLNDIKWIPEELKQKIENAYGNISKYVEGHAVSEESQDAPPNQATLNALCETVEKLKGEMKKVCPQAESVPSL